MAVKSDDTPLMMQYDSIKKNHPNEVLFFRLGDFYEMFNDDAVEVSRLLNLTLTHRTNRHMCGIPYHAAKVYIARLLRLGKKIAICEQVGEVAKSGKGITERKVVEIVTPGTAVEYEYLEGNTNNYLAALSVTRQRAGFSYIDVTTGTFKATSWQASNMAEEFPKELGRANPRELILPQSLSKNQTVQETISSFPNLSVSYYPDWDFSASVMYEKLTRQFKTANLNAFSLNENSAEVASAGFLLDYLEKTTGSSVPHVKSIDVYYDSDYLIIDDSSRRNLEVTANLRDGSVQYTLFDVVNYTKTAMGNRMIRTWLLFPLTDCKSINARQNHVALFAENRKLLSEIREKISPILDIERFASRIAMERAHAKDLQALRMSLEAWLSVRQILLQYDFSSAPSSDAEKIIDIVKNAINDDPPTILTDGGVIKSGWSEELDYWRDVRDNFGKILSEYEADERVATGIQNLKIKYTNASGYFIEVSKGKLSSVPPHFIMRRSLVNGDRYTTEKLQELEHKLNSAGSKIVELEYKLYSEIRNTLKQYVQYLLQVSADIAYTDVAASFAYVASVNNWVRPDVDESLEFVIDGGRHPVVEKHLPSGTFVPNDICLFSESGTAAKNAASNSVSTALNQNQIKTFALITGPNMAGKSTFLRQNALIALLAQAGSYVPAKKAHIGVVDKIFCRVGASDNLARGESTFLVEMTETALILRSATNRSLVIMDEVGRGTSTEDGLSIAQAVSEYLLNTLKCKTVFATHYHELTRMQNERLLLLCMDVAEENGSVVFLRKVKEGASANSYGIHVAQLAGVPGTVINRANEILSHIQNLANERPLLENISETLNGTDNSSESYDSNASDNEIDGSSFSQNYSSTSPGLFSDEEIILDEILSCDTDNITPLTALQNIARWKKRLTLM